MSSPPNRSLKMQKCELVVKIRKKKFLLQKAEENLGKITKNKFEF